MKVLLKPPQWTVFDCPERFRVLVAGRRFGKTFLALTELVRAAWGQGRKVWYIAPNLSASEARCLEGAEANDQTILGWQTQRN